MKSVVIFAWAASILHQTHAAPSGRGIQAVIRRTSAEAELFMKANTDHSDRLTLDKFLESMGSSTDNEMWVDWFHAHDRNGDGILTFEEVSIDFD